MIKRQFITITWVILLLMIGSFSLAQDDNSAEETEQTLTIWIPAPLNPADNPSAGDLLNDAIETFIGDSNLTVELRIKSVGGIISTLRTGSIVAPGALPDLTLMRRQDLLTAQAEGLIQPLENQFTSSLIDDLDYTLQLGQVDGTLYGIPYLLDIPVLVYRPQAGATYESWRFRDVLVRREALVFPALETTSLNDYVYLQYLSSGGFPPRSESLIFNGSALRNTLEFYEDAVATNVIDASILGFADTDSYETLFVEGGVNQAVFSISDYFRLRQAEDNLLFNTIPTADGNPTTLLDGWVWVMVTGDSNQIELGIRFVDLLMTPTRQSEVAQAMLMIPSQQSAFEEWIIGDVDKGLLDNLLESAELAISQQEAGTLGDAIQAAFIAIITQEQSVMEATAMVIDQQEE